MRSKLLNGVVSVAMLGAALIAGCGGGGGFGSGSTTGSTTGTSSGSTTGSTTGTTTSTVSNLYISAGSVTTSGTSSVVTLTATATDSSNVAVGAAAVSFSVSANCSCALVPASTTTDSSGTITATVTSSKPGTITVTATTSSLSAATQVTIPATPSYKLGTLSGSTFTAGQISIGQSSLSAGASTGLQVTVYDVNNDITYSGSASVAFTSNCISSGTATVVTPVATSTGTVNSTYTATGCSGTDTITATATLADGSAVTATGNVTVAAATSGSIIFDTADTTTTTIGLKGTGQNETAKVYFIVEDTTGNPVSGVTVNFALTTTVGGLALSPATATSDSSGKVYTTVSAGTVHTSVRVTASITSPNLSTQSSLLTVSTGYPAQNGMSLSASILNIEGNNWDGATTTINARLTDRYGNPVPDGTAVTFQTECGAVEPSCSTSSGGCSVTFTSQNPRTSKLVSEGFASSYDWYSRLSSNSSAAQCLSSSENALGCDDHRCTVLATAVGEESFVDCNGTGNYVSALNSNNNASSCPNGDAFVSLAEAIQDNNENGVFDSTETFVDFNNNGKLDAASGSFIGLLCNDPNCDINQSSLDVRQSIVIVMSSTTPVYAVAGGTGGSITIQVTDTAGQLMPAGTTIVANPSTNVSVTNPTSAAYTVLSSDACPGVAISGTYNGAISGGTYKLPADGCTAGTSETVFTFSYTGSGTISFTITTPTTNTATVTKSYSVS